MRLHWRRRKTKEEETALPLSHLRTARRTKQQRAGEQRCRSSSVRAGHWQSEEKEFGGRRKRTETSRCPSTSPEKTRQCLLFVSLGHFFPLFFFSFSTSSSSFLARPLLPLSLSPRSPLLEAPLRAPLNDHALHLCFLHPSSYWRKVFLGLVFSLSLSLSLSFPLSPSLSFFLLRQVHFFVRFTPPDKKRNQKLRRLRAA